MSVFNLNNFWALETAEHQDVASKTFETLQDEFARIIDICAASIASGGKLLFFGNGGSAADAQHLATELTIRYKQNRPPIAAIALTTDGSSLTAAGNDMGFDQIFARQLDALGSAGDVAIGLSTSGNSANVLNALEAARTKNMLTIGFSGHNGGEMPDLCDALLTVPSNTTARIQEMHITIGHMLCAVLEQKLGLS